MFLVITLSCFFSSQNRFGYGIKVLGMRVPRLNLRWDSSRLRRTDFPVVSMFKVHQVSGSLIQVLDSMTLISKWSLLDVWYRTSLNFQSAHIYARVRLNLYSLLALKLFHVAAYSILVELIETAAQDFIFHIQ
jgi:hypothetical protein